MSLVPNLSKLVQVSQRFLRDHGIFINFLPLPHLLLLLPLLLTLVLTLALTLALTLVLVLVLVVVPCRKIVLRVLTNLLRPKYVPKNIRLDTR
jgi:hypothetical protein